MWLQDEPPSRAEVVVHFLEKSLDSSIPPVEVNPLAEAQSQDDIILWELTLCCGGAVWDVITLQEGRQPHHMHRARELHQTHMNKLKVEWESGSSVLLGRVCSRCSWIAGAAGSSGVGVRTSDGSDGWREVHWATRQSQGRRKGSTVGGK